MNAKEKARLRLSSQSTEQVDTTRQDEKKGNLSTKKQAALQRLKNKSGTMVAQNSAVEDASPVTGTDEVAITDVEETTGVDETPPTRRMGATGLDLQVPIKTPLRQAEGQTLEETKEQIIPSAIGFTTGPVVGALELADLGVGLVEGAFNAVFPEADQPRYEAFLNGIVNQFETGYGESARKKLLDMGEKAGYNEKQMEVLDQSITAGTFLGIGGAAKAVVKNTTARAARLTDESEAFFNRKMNINRAKFATEEEITKKAEAAAEVASQNDDIARELIVNFEARTGKSISTETADGKLVLDADKARKAGVETAEEVSEDTRSTVRKYLATDVEMSDAALLAGQGDTLTQPLLKPEKFDALVATIADLKEKVPEAFKTRYFTNADGTQGKQYTVIDHLFDLTVNEKFQDSLKSDELIDMLNKYNISFEDYILTVVGSGSEAGKTLQKLSQIKRMRPANEMIAMQEAATKEAAGKIRKTIMRIENIRRGGLVSQIATAARNLQSGGIRAPLEGLGNVMDTALYNLSEEGVGAAVKSLGSFNNWKDSFRHMKYMFGPETRLDVEDYTDFILGQPELDKQFDLMFNNLNEIQKMTGRGDGGVLDTILSEAEDAVDVLNTPNRWQEFLIRRGAFLGELERLTKREYGIDLIDTINDGKIRDLLNDASSVRPEGARSFNKIVADATDRALDATYAKQPEIPVFRSTSQFITRNGLTVVLPFPRFMFNSMELMGQYAGGASIPLARKVASIVTGGKVGKGKLSAKDRQRISRNIVGMTAGAPIAPVAIGAFLEDPSEDGDGIVDSVVDYAGSMLQSMSVVGAFYQYRTSEDAPSNYKLMNTGNNTVLDTTPQYPLRQFAYLGEATKRLVNGTFDDWFDGKEFAETFLGTNIRQGVGNSLIEEVINSTMSTDLTSSEAWGRRTGRALGNYLATWAVPFSQIIEAERATGLRGVDFKDTGEDPTLDFQTSFMQNISRPFKRYMSAEEEAELPNREFLFTDKKSRVSPILRVLGGLNITTADEPYGEYLTSLGFTDYGLGSKSKVNSIRRFEDKVVREALPFIVEEAQIYEEDLRDRYKNSSKKLKEEFTEDKFVSSRIRKFVVDQIKDVRSEISDGSILSADAPEYAQAMLTYRRLSPKTRQAAGVMFFEQFDKRPDPLSKDDLNALVIIGQTYDEAFK